MTTHLTAMNARARARSLESQPEPATGASLGIPEAQAGEMPGQQPIPKTIAALTRNITACQQLLERYPQKLAAARQRQEGNEVAALLKEKANITARKEMLQRLHDNELKKSPLTG